tara:strand:+ start:1707 stop:2084 length:378 start_codon:yes stop_codon:yes gene_type:complete
MRTKTPEATLERIAELWRLGLSARDIAAAVGLSRNAVLGHVYRMRSKGFGFSERPKGQKAKVTVTAVKAEPEPQPLPPPRAGDPPWRCRSAGCGGVRQPGRDCCAACLTARHKKRLARKAKVANG